MKKKISDIPQTFLKIIVLIGLVVGYLALTTVAPTMKLELCDKKEQAEKDQQSDEQEEIKSFEAVHSNAPFTLEHHYFLLEELPEFACEDNKAELSEQSISLAGSKVLKILFRRIISPNAP